MDSVLVINSGGPVVTAANSTDGFDHLADVYFSPGSLTWSQPTPVPPQHECLRYTNRTPGYHSVDLTFVSCTIKKPSGAPCIASLDQMSTILDEILGLCVLHEVHDIPLCRGE